MRLRSKSLIRLFAFCITFMCCKVVYGQDQHIADSLILIYESGDFMAEDQLEILKNIAYYDPEPKQSLLFSEKLIQAAKTNNNIKFIISGYIGKGIALRMMGDMPEALDVFFEARKLASENQLMEELGIITVNIADTYSIINNHALAIHYYNIGIDILSSQNNAGLLSSSMYNLGDEYYSNGNLDSALYFYQESLPYFIEQKHEMGLAYCLGNIGQVFVQLGQYAAAEDNLNQAIEQLTPLGDDYGISVYLLSLSELYLARDQDIEARQYAKQSLQLAEEYGLKEQIRDANLMLSEISEKLGDFEQSLMYKEMYDIYKDSIKNLAVVQEMAQLRNEFEIAQKQSEVDLLTKEAEIADLRERRQLWVIIGTILSLILVAVVAITVYRRFRLVQKTNNLIQQEKNRSEDLLLNILPEKTALELKIKGNVQARRIEDVTVLFTDFIEFTRYAEQVAPEQMVRSIDFYFKQFDEIITRYHLEKIKTIGDSYMCAGGLHSESSMAIEVAKAALEMIAVTEKAKLASDDLIHFDMRIGIHTGPVVAGIVGTKKWQYDIWGDTVNIASGMESNSMSERVNISETTYQAIKDEFKAEYRGEIEIKHRGPVKMYFVEAPNLEWSHTDEPIDQLS